MTLYLLDGQLLLRDGQLANDEDCCDCGGGDPCECHPETWDWEVVIAGMSCPEFNGTYSYPGGAFTGSGSGACKIWGQRAGPVDLGGGNLYWVELIIYWSGTEIKAIVLSQLISGSLISFSFPETTISATCDPPSGVEVSGFGDCGASSASATYYATA